MKSVYSCPLELKFRIVRQFSFRILKYIPPTAFAYLQFSISLECSRREIRSELKAYSFVIPNKMNGRVLGQEHFTLVQKLVMADVPIPTSSQGVCS